MISTVSDLLLTLKDREQELLKQYDIVKHPGIIGNMYEGLTKDILSKSIFKGLGLQVKAGKIRNSKNEFSGEIDCMIVIGDGENIPYTDKFIYDSSKVIAVIQVKKNLFAKDIKDSYENLKTVINVTENRETERYHTILHRDTWRLMCKEELPQRKELEKLSVEKQMLYHILLLESFYPTRIVWGYNGFKSEFSLRESFSEYLKDNLSGSKDNRILGFGPLNFPSLIICDKYSLIKSNGIPFAAPILENDWWPIYFSSYDNPVSFLLEVLWTRLQYMFELSPEIFGEDLTQEEMHPYLLTRYNETKEMKGWEYNYIPVRKEELEKPLNHKEWEPSFLTETQYIVLTKLCKDGILDVIADEGFQDFLRKSGCELEELTISLKATGLVDFKDNKLTLITEQCVCGITPDGRYFAADNKTGRVTRWTIKLIDKNAL